MNKILNKNGLRSYCSFLLIMVSGLVLIAGAGCNKRLASVTKTVNDSVHVKESVSIRDTAVVIPGEKAIAEVVVPGIERFWPIRHSGDSTPMIVTQRSGHASVTVAAKGNVVTATANCDEYVKLLQLRDKTIETLSKHVNVKEEIKPRMYIPKWAWVLIIWGIVCAIFMVVKLYLKFI